MNALIKFFLGILFLLGVFGVVGTFVLLMRDSHKMPERPDHMTDELVAELPVQGRMSIGVVRYRNRLLTRHTGGAVDHDLYPMGDLEHIFISVGIQQLFDGGKLTFEDKLSKFVPDQPATLANLTLYQLLTHTAGLPQGVGLDDLDPSALNPPGKESAYSPAGYQLLSRVLVAASGKDLGTYYTQDIIEPLNANLKAYSGKKDYLKGAQLKDTGWLEADGDREAGWYTSLEDMLLWEDAMNSNMLVKMKTNQAAFTTPHLGPDSRGDFGFGWSIHEFRGFRLEQMGSFTSANNSITRFSERNFAVVILSELPADKVNTNHMGREIGEIYLRREMPLLADETEQAKY